MNFEVVTTLFQYLNVILVLTNSSRIGLWPVLTAVIVIE